MDFMKSISEKCKNCDSELKLEKVPGSKHYKWHCDKCNAFVEPQAFTKFEKVEDMIAWTGR